MSRCTAVFSLLLPALCLALAGAPAPLQPDTTRAPLVDKPRALAFPAAYDFDDHARARTFSPDGRILVFSDPKDCLIVWDLRTWKESKRLAPGSSHDGALVFSGDGKVLAVKGGIRTLRLLDPKTWLQTKEIEVPKDEWTSWGLSLSHDGNLVATPGTDNKVWLWNVAKNTTRLLEGHTTSLRCCAVSPDGRLVISGSGEQGSRNRPKSYPAELKFWDAATGQEIFSGSGTQGMIYTVRFSSDSKLLAILADDGTVRVWDVVLRRELFTLKDKDADSYIHAAVFTPDGKWILTAGFRSEIQAWDASTGRLEKTVQGGIPIVTSASFSPDGRNVLLTSNEDKKMKFLILADAKK